MPIPDGNWYPVLVEVVDLVRGSIPERVQYANMDYWRMDCPWWIVLLYNPISGLQRFLCHAIMSIAMVQSQMVVGDQLCTNQTQGVGGGGMISTPVLGGEGGWAGGGGREW